MHPTHVGAATNPLHVVGRSGVDIMAAGKGRKLVIVESPAKAKTIAGYLGGDFDVEASVGHIRDLPNPSELPADMKKGPFGKFADRRRQRLRGLLRRRQRQEEEGRRAQAAAQAGRRALPRHRRGPRGRGHRVAPPRDAPAARPGQADGVPRDHPRGDPARRHRHPRARHRPRGRPGDAPHPRPPLRLRGVAGAVAQGPPGPVRRPRAVRRHPAGRRARARADGVPGRRPTGTSRASSPRGRAPARWSSPTPSPRGSVP